MKAVIYTRVSSKEQKQEGYSIPAQKRLLWEFAKKNGIKIEKEFEDNETAKRAGRKNFGLMIDYLQKHPDIKTILVEKTDRLYRNFKDYVLVDDLDLDIYLVKENEKIGKDASSHQKFIHGIKVLMAKNHIDNLSEETMKGLTQKAEDGIYPSGSMPMGYKTKRINKRTLPIIDEENKDLIIRLFQLYATGSYSLNSLIEKVESEGFITKSKNTIQKKPPRLIKSTIARILRNPFYYGDFIWAGKLYKNGTHTPLITRELWDKVQKILNSKRDNDLAEYNKIDFTYKGLFKCGECGRTITAERKIKPNDKRYTYYRCTKYKTNCQQKPVDEKSIDTYISKALGGLRMPQKTIEYVSQGLKQSLNLKRITEDKMHDNLVAEKSLNRNRLDALYEDKLDGNISSDIYKIKSEIYEKKINELDDQIIKYTKADIDYYKLGINILELARNASFLYEKANSTEKRELLGFLLLDSTLKDGEPSLHYKKPFNMIYQRALCCDWLRE